MVLMSSLFTKISPVSMFLIQRSFIVSITFFLFINLYILIFSSYMNDFSFWMRGWRLSVCSLCMYVCIYISIYRRLSVCSLFMYGVLKMDQREKSLVYSCIVCFPRMPLYFIIISNIPQIKTICFLPAPKAH